jgi:16S rRNA (guanine966-N2)-methyltransferase
VRVVAGRFRGHGLVAPRGHSTRPTSDRVREALFSILAGPGPGSGWGWGSGSGSLEGAEVLDLFAGSGALAIEALSRGASKAVLVDSSAAAIAAIRRNLEAVGADAEVRRQDALAYLGRASSDGRQYDLVFLDPPYRQASAIGQRLSTALGPVLRPGARVVAESDRRAPLELDLALLDERRYGDTLIRIHGS